MKQKKGRGIFKETSNKFLNVLDVSNEQNWNDFKAMKAGWPSTEIIYDDEIPESEPQ